MFTPKTFHTARVISNSAYKDMVGLIVSHEEGLPVKVQFEFNGGKVSFSTKELEIGKHRQDPDSWFLTQEDN